MNGRAMPRRVGRGKLASRWRVLVVVAVLAGIVVSAGAAAPRALSSKQLGTVYIRLQQDWPTFDAYVDAGRGLPWAIDSSAYDRLVSYGPKGGGQIVPYLAGAWKVTPTSVTFSKIATDAQCASDGHILTPTDIMNSVQRFLDVPKRSGSVATNSIGGFGPGPFTLSASNKNHTFTFTSAHPWGTILPNFANLPIICPAGLAAVQQDPHALETAMYGSGPYTLTSAAHGDHISFQLRPNWHWGPPGTTAKTMPQQLVYKVVTDDTTAANLLLTGGLNISEVEGPDIQRLLASKKLTYHKAPNYEPLSLVFNMKPGSIYATDLGLRKAIATAVDPAQFNQAAYGGAAEVTPSVFRPGSPCYDPKTASLVPKPSISDAKAVLAQDGWTMQNGVLTKNGQPLNINLVLTPLMNQGPEYIDSVLTQLGANVNLSNTPGASYGTAVVTSNFDITILRGTYADPSAGSQLFALSGNPPPTGSNYPYTGYGDSTLAYYLNVARSEVPPAACKPYAKYQERLLTQYYLRPLVAPNFDLFATPGIEFSPVIPDGDANPVFYIHGSRNTTKTG